MDSAGILMNVTPCTGGQCNNLLGTFECKCESGYVLDQETNKCEDIDECLVENGGCHHICINIPGSIQCR